MNAVRDLKEWLARRVTLKNIGIRQLREQRMELDNEVRPLRQKLDLLEEDKSRLIAAFADARRLGKREHERFIARQFEELKAQIHHDEANHIRLTKSMRMLLGLERLKENEAWLNARGRASVFNMGLDRLQAYVETASARGELDMEKLDNLLYTLEDADARARESADASTEAALRELEDLVQSREAASPEAAETTAIEQELARVENGIAHLRQAESGWVLREKA